MPHRSQKRGIDSCQSCPGPSIVPIIFSIALGDQLHLLCMRHDHFVSQLSEQPAYPRGMGSGLQCDKTSRYLSKGLLHRFRCRRQFLFHNDLACFIQNTVERPAISQIQTDRQLLLLENFVLEYLYSGNLFHSRSPFLCASSTSNIGSVSHPAGDRPSHPICETALPSEDPAGVYRRDTSILRLGRKRTPVPEPVSFRRAGLDR